MYKDDDRHAPDLFSADLFDVPARDPNAPVDGNEVAASYQPRREGYAIVSIAINLAAVWAFVLTGAAGALYEAHRTFELADYALTPIYLSLMFIAHAAVNFPLELWAGYLEERQFGLAKNGIRAWSIDWLMGVGQHAVFFIAGSCLLVILQMHLAQMWLIASAAMLLVLFLLTGYLSLHLLPAGLFHIEFADEQTRRRLQSIVGDQSMRLPRVYVYSSSIQRDFAGGLLGLANRQALLISRSAVELASDTLLRFVLLHEMGHRKYHHVLLSTLIGWAWIVAGVVLCGSVAPAHTRGTVLFIPWLAAMLTTWLALTEPLIAFVGRRMEYAADRYYLRHGGTLSDLRLALTELSRRNLARTDAQSRRRTVLHPLPSVGARLHRASLFLQRKRGV